MTTPGADAFIRQLDQDPELLEQVRARILTRELLQLPETVAQLAAAQQEAAGRLDSLQTGQDSLQTGQDSLQTGQDSLQTGQDSLQTGQDSLQTGQDSLQTGQEQANSRLDDLTTAQEEATRRLASLQAGQESLQAGQESLQAGQESLQAGQESLQAGQESLQAGQEQANSRLDDLTTAQEEATRRLDSLQAGQERLQTGQEQANSRLDDLTASVQNLQGNLGNLTGTAYENRAARLAPRLLTRYLRMQNTQVLQAPNADTRPYLDRLVNQGVTDGRISDEEAQQLERADMIVTTTTGDAQTAYVVIEASVTVDDTDIDRAHHRALIMALITDAPTQAAVIGQDISPTNRQRADELGVTFMPLSQ